MIAAPHTTAIAAMVARARVSAGRRAAETRDERDAATDASDDAPMSRIQTSQLGLRKIMIMLCAFSSSKATRSSMSPYVAATSKPAAFARATISGRGENFARHDLLHNLEHGFGGGVDEGKRHGALVNLGLDVKVIAVSTPLDVDFNASLFVDAFPGVALALRDVAAE